VGSIALVVIGQQRDAVERRKSLVAIEDQILESRVSNERKRSQLVVLENQAAQRRQLLQDGAVKSADRI
jgi:hypothetical protein